MMRYEIEMKIWDIFHLKLQNKFENGFCLLSSIEIQQIEFRRIGSVFTFPHTNCVKNVREENFGIVCNF